MTRSFAASSATTTRPARSPRPVDAAALILVQRTGSEPRVLMGRRDDRHNFMPNLYAFPGGRVDAPDAGAWTRETFAEPVQMQLMARMAARPSRRRAHALGVAALRETLEETGLAVGKPGRMSADQAHGWPGFGAAGLVPCLAPLRFVARAITPPGFPKRYDCRFFLADSLSVRHAPVLPPSGELEDVDWVPLSRLARLNVPAITQRVLADLDPVLRGAPPGRPMLYHRRGKKALREAL